MTQGEWDWLNSSPCHALAVVDKEGCIRRVRTVGILGDKNAMAALERMEGDVVYYVTQGNAG